MSNLGNSQPVWWRMKQIFVVLGAAAALAGCEVFEAETETDLGVVFISGTPFEIGIPDTVPAGEAFQVNVLTYGNSCVEFARTEVEREGDVAEIRPYDRRDTESEDCVNNTTTIAHPVTLRFGAPGRATVRIVGLRAPANEPDVFDKHIVIQ
jgi:hypothetical protein